MIPLGLATLLVACSLGGPAGGPTKLGASTRVRPTGKTPAPTTGDGLISDKGGAVLSKLLKPAAGTVVLGGQVNIEASYALGEGGLLIGDAGSGLIGDAGSGLIGKVKLIGDAGSGLIGKVKAPLIGDAGSGVISNHGASIAVGGARVVDGRLVSNNSGSVIAEGAGNAIASFTGGRATALDDGTLLAGGALIGDAGSGLIGNNSGGLIGNNSGGLIGDAGSGLIGKTKYQAPRYSLAQATSGVGVALPAAGMLVGVVSLDTWEYLPLGQDASGKPVYAVYSDANGRFAVHVPEAKKDNVLVVTTVPGSRDPRGTYDFVATDRSAENAVDDLGRMVARYIRRTFTGRLADTIKAPEVTLLLLDREATLGGDPSKPDSAKGAVKVMVDLLVSLGAETGVGPDTPDDVLNRKAQRLIDLALARIDLRNLMITADDIPIWTDDVGIRPPYPVLDAYRAGLIVLLDGSTKQLRAEPNFFTQDYLANVINASSGGDAPPLMQDWTGRIKTPSDLGEFMMVEYFAAVRANGTAPNRRMFEIFHRARGDAGPEAAAFETIKVLSSTVSQTSVAICRVLAREDLRAEVRAILAEPDDRREPAKLDPGAKP